MWKVRSGWLPPLTSYIHLSASLMVTFKAYVISQFHAYISWAYWIYLQLIRLVFKFQTLLVRLISILMTDAHEPYQRRWFECRWQSSTSLRLALHPQVLRRNISMNYCLSLSRSSFLVWSLPTNGSLIIRSKALGSIWFPSAAHIVPHPMLVGNQFLMSVLVCMFDASSN